MQRDWRVIRTILIALEKNTYTERLSLNNFPDENPQEVSYNMELLISAGLVNGTMLSELGVEAQDFFAWTPTWQGHDFLASIRDKDIWSKLTKIITSKGGALTFELLKGIGVALAKDALIPAS